MAIHITASSIVTEVKPANGTEFSLEELQQYVGGYVEAVFHVDDGCTISDSEADTSIEVRPGDTLMVNEYGKIHNMPVNKIASLVYKYGTVDLIRGDALLVRDGEVG